MTNIKPVKNYSKILNCLIQCFGRDISSKIRINSSRRRIELLCENELYVVLGRFNFDEDVLIIDINLSGGRYVNLDNVIAILLKEKFCVNFLKVKKILDYYFLQKDNLFSLEIRLNDTREFEYVFNMNYSSEFGTICYKEPYYLNKSIFDNGFLDFIENIMNLEISAEDRVSFSLKNIVKYGKVYQLMKY